MDWQASRHVRACRTPMVVGLEFYSDPLIEDPEIAVAPAHHGGGCDVLHLLRHNADIGRVAPVIGEAVEADAVVEVPKQHDVMLERDVGSPTAAAASATTASATTA